MSEEAENIDANCNGAVNYELCKKYLDKGLTDSELFIGLVCSIGAAKIDVIEALKTQLSLLDYEVEVVRVSKLFPDRNVEGKSAFEAIEFYMDQGDELREKNKSGAILAKGVVTEINKKRDSPSCVGSKKAYIIDSLKHTKEVEFLRKVYGKGFYLIGIHAEETRRIGNLRKRRLTTTEAQKLIQRDEHEEDKYGQKTRSTYQLADLFLDLGNEKDYIENSISRFIDLIFSNPHRTPTFDEYAMFMAFNSAVRSSDLSRQVGSVISKDQQIIATGANDCPRAGGGLYWTEIDPKTGEVIETPEGKDQLRTHPKTNEVGYDSNKEAQLEIIDQISDAAVNGKVVPKTKIDKLRKVLLNSKISDLTEFGRVVHAEMEALLSCGRMGIVTKGATLYCTTFPCHNCAKHIIDAGIERVVYVEAYPKSRTDDNHGEAIALRQKDGEYPKDKVIFEPFRGIGANRFLDLFSMNMGAGAKVSRKDKETGAKLKWEQNGAAIRTPLLPMKYTDLEQTAKEQWDEALNLNKK